jgi:hypothetical protein
MALVNLDAANTTISVNSLGFEIMVSDLTDNVRKPLDASRMLSCFFIENFDILMCVFQTFFQWETAS